MSIKLRLLLLYLQYFSKNDLSLAPAVIRKANAKKLDRELRLIAYAPDPLHDIKDHEVAMRDGVLIRVRIYTPIDSDGLLPLIIYYHGGGFVLRSIESHDRVCRRVSKMNNAIVVSVDYRMAPEHKFPIPHQDCYDAYIWAVKNAQKLRADGSQVTVMGDSAGGNLATVVSILSRDLEGPAISNQVLIYPCTDASKTYPSEVKYGKGYLLTKERMDWFTDHYKQVEEDVSNPLFSPLLTDDLSRLPRTFLFTAEYDPLKGEGVAYAQKLEAAGNKVEYKEYPNVIHGFFNMPKISQECTDAYNDVKSFLN